MRVLQLDSTGGASGDMILGVLVDLGVGAEMLQETVGTLEIEDFEILVTQIDRDGVNGQQVQVKLRHEVSDEHNHRHLGDIRKIVSDSTLSAAVQKMSMEVFRRLAEAEAHVHGTSVEEVHFHEVGAVDSIVDIVGSCVGLVALGVEGVVVGTLPLGTGTIECSHGTIPVPAPATVELLKGYSVVQTNEPFELVTPTGAALLTTWSRELPADGFSSLEPEALAGCESGKLGNAFGHHKLNGRPNLLRGLLTED